MDPALGIAIAVASANLMMAALHLGLAQGPRRRIGRLCALIALTAAIYGTVNAVFCITGLSDPVYLAAGELAYVVGAIHIVLWIAYAYSGPEVSFRKLPSRLQALIALIVGVAAGGAAAGGLLKPQVSVVPISWAGVSYHYPVNSTAGEIYGIAGLVLFVVVFWRLLSRYGRGEWDLRLHVACFGLFFVCALEHLLVARALLSFLSLLDFGLLFLVTPLWWQAVGRITGVRHSEQRSSGPEAGLPEERWFASEARFQQVAADAGVFVWEMDAKGLYTYASSSVEKMLGYTPDELVGKLHYHDLFAPPFREELKLAAEETFRRRAKFETFLNPVVTSDGRFVLLEKTGVPLQDAAGNLAGYRGSDRDVTERKRDEAALRESRATILGQLQEIEAIYEGAPVGLCVMDADLRFQRINERLAEINGLPADQHLGRTIGEVMPNLAPFIEPVYRQVLETGKPVIDLEIHGGTPALPGAERVFLASFFSLRASADGYAGINVVVQDITDRKRAEAALAESENRFRSMADSAPVIIWLTDAAGTICFVNRQALLFTGRTEEELCGCKWLELIHREDVGRATAVATAALERRDSGQLELRLRRADGRHRWMLATATPRLTGPEFGGHIGTLVDITELKQEQERVLANQKLESLGVLAAGIAHEFNNRLANIVADAEVVSAEIGDVSAVSEGLERIRQVALRASETVRELFAYAGQEKAEFTSLDLGELIGDMAQSMRLAISRNATLEVDLPEKLPPVYANAAQIRQVLINLVTNAAEALDNRSGVISVRASRSAPGTESEEIAGLDGVPADYVRLEVADNGSGMSEEVCSRIFDPFFTTKFPGRGLGLAAVQGIVRLHGGSIQVDSAPGSGTRIAILLRIAGEPGRHSSEAPASIIATVATAPSTRSVLMIEDEEALRSAVCKMLRKNGYSVLEAEDGVGAVEMFRAKYREIGVVLLDLALPGLGGREILVEIRRLRPDVKIIVTTAYSRETATASLDGHDGWSFIRKPYRVAEVISMLQESLA